MKSTGYCRGATMVETTLVLLVLVLFTLFVLQMFLYWRLVLTTDVALADTVRWAKLGLTDQGLTREGTIENYFRSKMSDYTVDPTQFVFRICPIYDPRCTQNNAGLLDETFLVEATAPSYSVLQMYSLPIHSIFFGRNEPA